MTAQRIISLLHAWTEPGPLAKELRNETVAAGAELRAHAEYERLTEIMARAYGRSAVAAQPPQILDAESMEEAFLAGLTLGLSIAASTDDGWELY